MPKAPQIPKKDLYTYEDYSKLPEGAPYQLIGGKLVRTPAPSTRHQIICARLVFRLSDFVRQHNLGLVLFSPIDVYFEETETYQPDIIFISGERLEIIEEERIKGAPDLVVEIISPSTAYYDLRKKFKIYEKHGVKEYWIVDPEERSVAIYENQGGKFVLIQEVFERGKAKSKVLENFELEVGELW